jgi:hypothetical protein
MKAPIVSGPSRWKSVGLALVLVVAPALSVVAKAEPADADALRQQAVSQYVDAATKELNAYRQEITAASRADNQQQLGEAKAELDECDRLVVNLKSADSKQFDLIKADYERTRGAMVKALHAAQKA